MELALAHRMRSRPFEPPTLNKDKLEKSMEKQQQDQQQQKQKQKQQQQQQQEQQPSSLPSRKNRSNSPRV